MEWCEKKKLCRQRNKTGGRGKRTPIPDSGISSDKDHEFYGPEMVQNDIKERRKQKEGRGKGRKKLGNLVFILATLAIHTTPSKKYDLSGLVFKNLGRYAWTALNIIIHSFSPL